MNSLLPSCLVIVCVWDCVCQCGCVLWLPQSSAPAVFTFTFVYILSDWYLLLSDCCDLSCVGSSPVAWHSLWSSFPGYCLCFTTDSTHHFPRLWFIIYWIASPTWLPIEVPAPLANFCVLCFESFWPWTVYLSNKHFYLHISSTRFLTVAVSLFNSKLYRLDCYAFVQRLWPKSLSSFQD